uniref:Bursicon beta-type n=1 Tax=Stichopus japonicus TaxID=307972 RepID=A0A2Z4C1R0_STIJA|nr:bursicon-beta-like precursor [Apostichopus japonicus]AXU40275.1 bursicon beta-type precursor [Apostichopus japonicus]
MSFLLLLLVCAAQGVLVHSRNERERCELLSKQINARMEEYDSDLGQTVHCRGRITAQYCEGSCRSKAIPSVTYVSGFQRLCRCCFETDTRTTSVWLDHCVTQDRRSLSGRYFQMREPTSCSCQRC